MLCSRGLDAAQTRRDEAEMVKPKAFDHLGLLSEFITVLKRRGGVRESYEERGRDKAKSP